MVITRDEAQHAWASQSHDAVDGRELTVSKIDKASHLLLQKPMRVFPSLHLRGIQLRGGVLSTKARGSRSRPDKADDITCWGACAMQETLNHVLQVCEVTHPARCARHNRVMRLAEKMLRMVKRSIWTEPVIATAHSYIKPDLVMEEPLKLTVLDVSVVAGRRMTETWNLKVEKYWSLSNIKAIKRWRETEEIILPLIFSNRGLLYEPSGAGLR